MDLDRPTAKRPAMTYGRKRGQLSRTPSTTEVHQPPRLEPSTDEHRLKRQRLTPGPLELAEPPILARSRTLGLRKQISESSIGGIKYSLPVLGDKSNLPPNTGLAISVRPPKSAQTAGQFLPSAFRARSRDSLNVYVDQDSPVVRVKVRDRYEGVVKESTPAREGTGPSLPDFDISDIPVVVDDSLASFAPSSEDRPSVLPVAAHESEREQTDRHEEGAEAPMRVDGLAREQVPARDEVDSDLERAAGPSQDVTRTKANDLPLPAIADICIPPTAETEPDDGEETIDEDEGEEELNAGDGLAIDSTEFALPSDDELAVGPDHGAGEEKNLHVPNDNVDVIVSRGVDEEHTEKDEVAPLARRRSSVRFGSPIAEMRSPSPDPSDDGTTTAEEEEELASTTDPSPESSQTSSLSSPLKLPAKSRSAKAPSVGSLETLRARFALSAIECTSPPRPAQTRSRALKTERAAFTSIEMKRDEATARMARRPGAGSSKVVPITSRLKQAKMEGKGKVQAVVRATRILDKAPSVASDASLDEMAIIPAVKA